MSCEVQNEKAVKQYIKVIWAHNETENNVSLNGEV